MIDFVQNDQAVLRLSGGLSRIALQTTFQLLFYRQLFKLFGYISKVIGTVDNTSD